jgi:hypothetical protein
LTDVEIKGKAHAVSMSAAPARNLTIVGRSLAGPPRTFRLERHSASPDAAYRRLATAILRLDVTSLGNDLRAHRLRLKLPHAA